MTRTSVRRGGDAVTVLLVADGASEPVGDEPTSLERAATPVLDELLREGVLQSAITTPDGVAPGTEVGMPALLGAALAVPLARGRVEAAWAGVVLGEGEGAWRLDLVPRATPGPELVARLAEAVAALGGRVHHLRGHRLLLVGPSWWGDAPVGPHQTERPLRELATGPFAGVAKACGAVLRDAAAAGDPAAQVARRAWPWGLLQPQPAPHLPALLGLPVTVLADGSAAAVATLLGCDVVHGNASGAAELVDAAAPGSVVVAVDPAPDAAAHARDAAAKIAALEAFDRDVVGRVAAVLRRRGGRLLVAADHGCDPATGRHTRDPVPVVLWATGYASSDRGPRWTERDAARFRAVPADLLLPEQLRMAAA